MESKPTETPTTDCSNVTEENFCQKMPKIELNAHLNGSLSVSTLGTLIRLKDVFSGPEFNAESATKLTQKMPKNLTEVFQLFDLLQTITSSITAISVAAQHVTQEFAAENVRYLELRTTPRALDDKTKLEYLTAMWDGVVRAIKECHCSWIRVAILVSIDRRRSIEDAWENLETALEAKNSHGVPVVGIEISGDPTCGNLATFIPLLSAARAAGLKTSVHLSEIQGEQYAGEIDAILEFGPDRIGHGTYLSPVNGGKSKWTEAIREKKIPLELCLTSNLVSSTVPNADDHHFRYWYNLGHPIVVCTDDKGVFNTSLSNEYELVKKHFHLSNAQLFELSQRAIDAAFASDELKAQLRAEWKSFTDQECEETKQLQNK